MREPTLRQLATFPQQPLAAFAMNPTTIHADRISLGHGSAAVTEVYAEKDAQQAIRRVGWRRG